MLLALDLSTKTGWAMGDRADKVPVSGTWLLKSPHDDIWRAGRNLGRQLVKVFSQYREGNLSVIYEAPVSAFALAQDGGSRAEIISLLHGLAMAVHAVAGPYGITPTSAHVQSVRKFFVGQGRPENPKRVVLERCRALGWGSTKMDDNEADALALWAYAAGRSH